MNERRDRMEETSARENMRVRREGKNEGGGGGYENG